MTLRTWLATRIVLLAVVATPLSARELQTANCANLSPREAAILIHFLPQGEQLRRQGMDIGWERAPKAEVGRNAFVFWVYNAKRTATGSVTIGYFVVDRCTANVTDDANGTTVKSPTLAALQRILSP